MHVGRSDAQQAKSESFLISQTKKQTVDRLSKAAKEGIKELNVDNSGNTIVHDAIHLHDSRLFKMIFKEGILCLDKYVNTPNSAGSTPLIEAAKEGSFEIVEELMKHGAHNSHTINQADNDGLTPLHAAIQSGNLKLVKLLLSYGAESSVNSPDSKGVMPLHSAVVMKDTKLVKTLLRYGAKKSITAVDSKGISPKQMAIITGQVSVVKEMLDSDPELAKRLNTPDKFGITDLQRAARNGNVEMMGLLLSRYGDEAVKVDPKAFFTMEDLEACLTPSEIGVVESLPIDNVAFPLTVIQNYCSVMIRLKNGEILQVRNADAVEVRDTIMQKKYGPEWKSEEGANVLTFYLTPGHGFMRLECRNCDGEKPYNANSGFYPLGQKLEEGRLHAFQRRWQAEKEAKKEAVRKSVMQPQKALSIAPPESKATEKNVEEFITKVEDANLIFTIAKNDVTVSINSTTTKPLTMLRETYVDMLKTIIEGNNSPEEISGAIYERILSETTEGSSVPEPQDLEGVVRDLHQLKTASLSLGKWIQETFAHIDPATNESSPLEGREVIAIVDYLLNIKDKDSVTPFITLLNSTLFSLSNQQSAPIGMINSETSNAAAFLADISRGMSMEEVVLKNFGKLVGQDYETLTASETETLIQKLYESSSIFTSQVLGAVKSLPTFAQSTIGSLPDPKSLWDGVIDVSEVADDFVRVASGVPLQAFLPSFFDFYLKFKEQPGQVANEEWYESECDSLNTIKLMFYMSDEQAKQALDTVQDVSLSCRENPEKSCRYHMLNENCMDFLQKVFASTGSQGDLIDFLSDNQIGQGHLFSARKLYEFKSLDYGFIRSRGLPHYLSAALYPKINEAFNTIAPHLGIEQDAFAKAHPLPEKIINLQEFVARLPHEVAIPLPTEEIPKEGNFTTAEVEQTLTTSNLGPIPYTASIADNISLAFVATKIARNALSGLGSLWNTFTDTKATELAITQVLVKLPMVSEKLSDLDRMNDVLDLELEILDEELEESQSQDTTNSLRKERASLIEMSNEYIELSTQGYQLEEELKRVKESYSKPTTSYIEALENRLQEFATKVISLEATFNRIIPSLT